MICNTVCPNPIFEGSQVDHPKTIAAASNAESSMVLVYQRDHYNLYSSNKSMGPDSGTLRIKVITTRPK
eukprot:3936040-Rhodomonas_salina.2